MKITRNIMALAILAVVAIGCGERREDGPSIEPTHIELGGKADGADVSLRSVGGGYRAVRLQGDAAKDLWGVLESAGSFQSFDRGGLSYLSGTYVVCVTNGQAAACEIYSRQASGQDGRFEAKVHGKRFGSAASELFGALARAEGVNPSGVTVVESDNILCGKSTRDVWCGIDGDPGKGAEIGLRVSFSGLGRLGSGYVYEGWLITADGPVSAGRFSDPKGYEVKVPSSLLGEATLYVLTIEPATGDDPAPSATHVLAGELSNGRAALTTAHGAALGSDFTPASGGFILETPSSSAADDYDQGIWFLDPSAGPGAALSLPKLPDGWSYEGWVVVDGKPVSTGRFTATTGADSDGAGPAAGSAGAPPFPGQDFINPPLRLTGGMAVISVEPDPDDSSAPFALKPLAGNITAAGPGALRALQNTARAAAITGVAIFTPMSKGQRVVVANRAGKSITVIDSESDDVLWTVAMPDEGEPMYVTYDRQRERVMVGDRENDRVVAFDARDFSVAGFASAGKGVFHMWDADDDSTLWVVNDVDKTLTVIDQASLETLATVAIPADLAAAGGKPHDVIVDPFGHAIYTTIVGLPGRSVVLKLSTKGTHKELARASVGGDAHLSLNRRDLRLYVPCQDDDSIYLLHRSNLAEVGRRALSGAHGAGMSRDGRYLYIGNLPAAGPMAVYTMDTAQQSLVGQAVDVPSDGKPHNLAVSADGSKLFVTHSGPNARRISVLSLANRAQPTLVTELDAGANPFGLVSFRR